MARRKRRPATAHQLPDHARSRGDGAERHQRLYRGDVAATGRTAKRARVAEALDAANGVRLCTLCSRAAKGLYYTHLHRPELHPTYAFCSVRCLRAGAAIAKRNLGMINKTKLETQAIKAARR